MSPIRVFGDRTWDSALLSWTRTTLPISTCTFSDKAALATFPAASGHGTRWGRHTVLGQPRWPPPAASIALPFSSPASCLPPASHPHPSSPPSDNGSNAFVSYQIEHKLEEYLRILGKNSVHTY